MKKSIKLLCVIAAIIAIISACVGIFYTYGGNHRIVKNIYGQSVTLYGDGIYANDSIMKAGATKGTDIAVIIVCITLLAIIFVNKNKKASSFIQAGLLSIILYSSTCLIMGINFNRLFLLYIIQFGSSLFAFVLSLDQIIKSDNLDSAVYEKKLKVTGIYMIIAGCSVLIWLTFILPAVITGKPMEIIGVYTTEPTFAIDLAIIFPSAVFCGVMLLKKKKIGYKVAPVLLTLITGVGICVIFQTIVQSLLGIALPVGQTFGLGISFIILGIVAVILNAYLLKLAK